MAPKSKAVAKPVKASAGSLKRSMGLKAMKVMKVATLKRSGSNVSTSSKASDKPMKAMKKGFPRPVCPVAKVDFIEHAVPHKFIIDATPTVFAPGSFGYKWNNPQLKLEADGPNSHALGDKVVRCSTTCNFIVLGSNPKTGNTCGLTKEQFQKATNGKNLKQELEAEAYEFSTGSFGWQTNGKLKRKVAGVDVTLQYNVNAVVQGSKPASGAVEKDEFMKKTSSNIIAKHLPKLGPVTGPKDDLKVVKGIGPFIERRLNHIQISKYSQIAKMTPAIETDVVKAIQYFPGRQRRDKWVEQAAQLAKKKSK